MKFLRMTGSAMGIILMISPFIIKSQNGVPPNTTQLALTDSLRAQYWRAQYELCRDENIANLSRAKWLETIKDVSAACGVPTGTTEVNLNGDGEPYCKVPVVQ